MEIFNVEQRTEIRLNHETSKLIIYKDFQSRNLFDMNQGTVIYQEIVMYDNDIDKLSISSSYHDIFTFRPKLVSIGGQHYTWQSYDANWNKLLDVKLF